MPGDLHGSVPDESRVALLLVDVINPFDFDGAEQLVEHARPMSRHLGELCRRARDEQVPIVYANDNFGRWQSDRQAIVESALSAPGPASELVRSLLPESNDYFVVKPKQSAFYSTTLELLLRHLGAERLIIAGLQAHLCVLFTANDAYLRDFVVYVPEDCVASETDHQKVSALELLRITIEAVTTPSADLDLTKLRSERASRA